MWENLGRGLVLFLIGLLKKVAIADTLGHLADPAFARAAATTLTAAEAWVGGLAFTFQLYFDFSGYSDMAIGLALMFGLTLPINFNSPYKAVSSRDLWRRWHITLSRFLRDYLYIPLGGSRHGETRQVFNVIVTMLLGGLWHGANWNCVAWGGLQGVGLAVNHAWDRTGIKLPRFLGWAITFFFFFATLMVFHSPGFAVAGRFLLSLARCLRARPRAPRSGTLDRAGRRRRRSPSSAGPARRSRCAGSSRVPGSPGPQGRSRSGCCCWSAAGCPTCSSTSSSDMSWRSFVLAPACGRPWRQRGAVRAACAARPMGHAAVPESAAASCRPTIASAGHIRSLPASRASTP